MHTFEKRLRNCDFRCSPSILLLLFRSLTVSIMFLRVTIRLREYEDSGKLANKCENQHQLNPHEAIFHNMKAEAKSWRLHPKGMKQRSEEVEDMHALNEGREKKRLSPAEASSPHVTFQDNFILLFSSFTLINMKTVSRGRSQQRKESRKDGLITKSGLLFCNDGT